MFMFPLLKAKHAILYPNSEGGGHRNLMEELAAVSFTCLHPYIFVGTEGTGGHLEHLVF